MWNFEFILFVIFVGKELTCVYVYKVEYEKKHWDPMVYIKELYWVGMQGRGGLSFCGVLAET